MSNWFNNTPNPHDAADRIRREVEAIHNDPKTRAQVVQLAAALRTAAAVKPVLAEAATLEVGRKLAGAVGPEVTQQMAGMAVETLEALAATQLPSSLVPAARLGTAAQRLLAGAGGAEAAVGGAMVAGETGALAAGVATASFASVGRAAAGAAMRSSIAGAAVGTVVNGTIAGHRVATGRSTAKEAATDFAADTGKDAASSGIATAAAVGVAAVFGAAATPALLAGAAVGIAARVAMGTSRPRR